MKGTGNVMAKTKNEIKVKNSHHISTEPLLNVIHDRRLRYRNLWSKAMDKPRAPAKPPNKAAPPNKNRKKKNNHIITRSSAKKITAATHAITVCLDSHNQPHTLSHTQKHNKHEHCYIVQHAVIGRVKNEELSGKKRGEAQPGIGGYNSSDQRLKTG